MKKTFTFLLVLITFTAFGQNKKEQIAILSARVDSLFQALNTEKSERASTEKEMQSQISLLQSQLTNEQNEKKTVEANLALRTQELSSQKEENQNITAQLNETEKARLALEENYNNTSAQLSETEKARVALEKKYNETSAQLSETEKARGALEEKYNETSAQLKETENERMALVEKYNTTSEELIEQINQNETLVALQQKTMEAMNQKELELAELLGSYNELIDQMEGEYQPEDAMIYDNEEANDGGSNAGNPKWDKVLDDYENYVVEYAKFYKKAMSGDMSAMTKYPALMEKATKLSQSLEGAQNSNDLSQKQMNRFIQIQGKFMEAVGY